MIASHEKAASIQLDDPSLVRQMCYIDGQWITAEDGASFDILDPATNEVIGTMPRLGIAQTRAAIEAAARALPAWKAQTASQRAEFLHRWHDLIQANTEDLARIMTAEQGKPLAEARGEIAYAASFVKWFAEEARRIYGDIIPHNVLGRRLLVLKEPVGVVAAITPWNFPAAMITRKVAPALAAGCTVVARPASQTPFSAIALIELAARAGMPAGVVNVITGSAAEQGRELTFSPLVRKVTFTGSTEIGKLLMSQSASTVKRVSLELGGNAPFLVFDDADLDAAVAGAVASKFRNAGQTCVCANRIFVQDGVHDVFVEKLVTAVERLKVGKGTDPGVTIGPLIDNAAIANIEKYIADATKAGGRIVTGGQRHSLGGRFFEPTVIVGATLEMKLAREETFGPLAPIFRFTTEEEGIALANDTEFGLAAYFYARDLGRVWRVAEALEAGLVGVNEGAISTEVAPFGGVKQSGIGREGAYQGIDEYLEVKYVAMGGL